MPRLPTTIEVWYARFIGVFGRNLNTPVSLYDALSLDWQTDLELGASSLSRLIASYAVSRCDVGHDAMSHIWPDGGDCVGILMVIDCLRARPRRRQQCRLSDDVLGSCTR